MVLVNVTAERFLNYCKYTWGLQQLPVSANEMEFTLKFSKPTIHNGS